MSAVACVEQIIADALHYSASDIHIESLRDTLLIRYRIDGILIDHKNLDYALSMQVIARIKVLANLDVAEKRLPQDGKFCTVTPAGEIDLRVSTFPALYGEKVVIRILDRFVNLLDSAHIGLSPALYAQFKKTISRTNGFLLVTGPTGSGKTTTLYAALQELISPEKSIATLENPIEYNMRGVTQGQVHPEIGFTFAKGLRALLRQDPDIIMVGEIRDKETAEIAIQAALTGHLVLSSLHTHDAPGALMRLLDMGIPAFLLNASLTGILAQRLARKLCLHCREQRVLTSEESLLIRQYQLPIEQSYVSPGCEQCHNLGHKGRIGIFELLSVTGSMRRLITSHPHIDDIKAQACVDGMKPLLYDAALKVDAGIISFAELLLIV